jgi:hypothetical protein
VAGPAPVRRIRGRPPAGRLGRRAGIDPPVLRQGRRHPATLGRPPAPRRPAVTGSFPLVTRSLCHRAADPQDAPADRRAHRPVTIPTVPVGGHACRGQQGPVAQLASAPPCHGGGRGFESRRGRGSYHAWAGSSVGTSVRLKSGRSAVRPRPCPPLRPGRTEAAGMSAASLVSVLVSFVPGAARLAGQRRTGGYAGAQG